MMYLQARQMEMALMPAPPGYTQNFVDPEYIGYQVWVCSAVFLAVAFVFMCIRIYTRIVLTRSFGTDDCLLIAGMLFSIGLSTSCIIQTLNGLGTHLWNVPIQIFSPNFLKINYVNGLLYVLTLQSTKQSVLFLLLRISPGRIYRICVITAIVTIALYGIGGGIAIIFACVPIEEAWDITITDGRCIDRPAVAVAASLLNVFFDFAIFLLPIPTIMKLQLPTRQKMGLLAVFSVGLFVCVVAIVRTVQVFPLLTDPDITWTSVNATDWSIIEMNTSIICASMATFRPFFVRYVPSLISKLTSRGSSSSANASGGKGGSTARKGSSTLSNPWSTSRRHAKHSLLGGSSQADFDYPAVELGHNLQDVYVSGGGEEKRAGDRAGPVDAWLAEDVARRGLQSPDAIYKTVDLRVSRE